MPFHINGRFKRHFLQTAALFGVLLCLVPCAQARDAQDRVVFLHYWTGALNGGVNEMVASFNKLQPGIPLAGTGFEHESFKVGIRPMLASQQPPDLFSYWAGARTQSLVDSGLLAPIDDVWAEQQLDRRFSAAVSRACTYSGRKYAVPLTQHYVAIFYDKKLFGSLGLKPPATWDEFLATCARIKAAGRIPVALGARDKWPSQFWFDFLLLYTAGSSYRDWLMLGQASWRDPEVIKAFQLWQDMLARGFFTPQPSLYDWSEAAKSVANGQAAMTLMGTWIIGLFEGKLDLKEEVDFDFFPFPQVDPKQPLVSIGPIDVALVAKSGDAISAKKVAAFFSEVGPQQAMSRGSGALSPSRDIPPSFYSSLRKRILETITTTPGWDFAFDLAAPPSVAQAGLNAFSAFLSNPNGLDGYLAKLDETMAACRKEGECPR